MTIDNLCSQFNLTLMELKIENAKAFVLGREKPLEDVRFRSLVIFIYVLYLDKLCAMLLNSVTYMGFNKLVKLDLV